MAEAKYDAFSEYYSNFVAQNRKSPNSVHSFVTQTMLEIAGDVDGQLICDVACGEGHLSRCLANNGATVVGIDISRELLALAQTLTSPSLSVTYQVDDAQQLQSVAANFFDTAVCNLALMDIPDHRALFTAVARILKPGGQFIFSLLHPCFETPFTVPESVIEQNEKGEFEACRVWRYTEEGYWNSGGSGVRGRVGAYHRKLSTYINDLLTVGFQLQAVHEPTLPGANYKTLEGQWLNKIPRGLLISAQKPS